MILDPGVIQARVVGDEVEHQLKATLPEPLAETVQGNVPSQILVHRVPGDREPRAGNVLIAQVRESFFEFPPPFGVGPRDSLADCARLPHAQEPDPVEAHLGDAVQLGVGNVVERGRPASGTEQLGQPHSGVDLKQRRVPGVRHGLCPTTSSAYCVLPTSSIFSGSTVAKTCIRRATTPVQPVWWFAPSPAPLSPWKYSWNNTQSRQCGSFWNFSVPP